jgi:hypothetical protein
VNEVLRHRRNLPLIGLRHLQLARGKNRSSIDLVLQARARAHEHAVVHGRRDHHEQDRRDKAECHGDAARGVTHPLAKRRTDAVKPGEVNRCR